MKGLVSLCFSCLWGWEDWFLYVFVCNGYIYIGWCGEVRGISFSADGRFVTVIYRVTIKGSDGEVCYNNKFFGFFYPFLHVYNQVYMIFFLFLLDSNHVCIFCIINLLFSSLTPYIQFFLSFLILVCIINLLFWNLMMCYMFPLDSNMSVTFLFSTLTHESFSQG